MAIDRDALDAITRVAIARCHAKVDHVLNEYRGRELGHADRQALIGQIQDSMRDAFADLIPPIAMRHSTK
jgi:hypothetical protein